MKTFSEDPLGLAVKDCALAQRLRLCFAVLLLGAGVSAPAEELISGYQLGRGLEFPTAKLSLGGYMSLQVRNLHQQDAQLSLEDLSLFATWRPTSRWLVFSEMEIEDSFSIDDRGLTAADSELALERLYTDYTLKPWLSLRAGKFLTPVGRWNTVHAAPLVWTVSRPLVTELPFASTATGLAAYGSLQTGDDSLDYMLFVDDSEDFDPANGESDFEGVNLPGESNDFQQAAGLQLRYHFMNDQAELAASYTRFKMHHQNDHKQLLGVDFYWSGHGYELSSELAYRFNEGIEANEWGGFVQAVMPLAMGLNLYGRYENYEAHSRAVDTRVRIIGAAWRPTPPLTVKLEWRDVDNQRLVPGGWLSSLSVLF